MYANKSSKYLIVWPEEQINSARQLMSISVCAHKNDCVSILLLLFCRGDKKEHAQKDSDTLLSKSERCEGFQIQELQQQ